MTVVRERERIGPRLLLASGNEKKQRELQAMLRPLGVELVTPADVGGLPEELGFELVEPLRSLFKDEVRKLGEVLGLPEHLVWRHPFPGPGLAVRVLGEVTPEQLTLLRDADEILLEEIVANNLYRRTAQVFAVLLPVKAVGVMGDSRTHEQVIAIRAVFGDDSGVFVNNTKSYIGHCMGGAGALELAGNLPAFEDRTVHPTINVDELDPECELPGLVINEPREVKQVDVILNNSFGMLGINSAVIVRRFVK